MKYVGNLFNVRWTGRSQPGYSTLFAFSILEPLTVPPPLGLKNISGDPGRKSQTCSWRTRTSPGPAPSWGKQGLSHIGTSATGAVLGPTRQLRGDQNTLPQVPPCFSQDLITAPSPSGGGFQENPPYSLPLSLSPYSGNSEQHPPPTLALCWGTNLLAGSQNGLLPSSHFLPSQSGGAHQRFPSARQRSITGGSELPRAPPIREARKGVW